MNKRKSRAFGKDVYLVGINQYDEFVWLEEPSWDCGWYWGFGYLEVYTNQKQPNNSRDITSHTHWNFNGEMHQWKETVLTDEELSEVNDMFDAFYSYKEIAERNKDTRQAKRINEVDIPRVTKRIIEIFTP